jgi:Flp pilus assembly protein TadB
MVRLPNSMTPTVIAYTAVISFLIFFFGWMVTPTLDSIREKWRERLTNAPLNPETEAVMLKQLRMQQASLKRLEQFRANQVDAILYVLSLLGAGLLLFVVAVYLYPFQIRVLCLLPAVMSLFFFLAAIIEARNMTAKKMNATLAKLKETIEEGKAKLKVSD